MTCKIKDFSLSLSLPPSLSPPPFPLSQSSFSQSSFFSDLNWIDKQVKGEGVLTDCTVTASCFSLLLERPSHPGLGTFTISHFIQPSLTHQCSSHPPTPPPFLPHSSYHVCISCFIFRLQFQCLIIINLLWASTTNRKLLYIYF